MKDYRVRRTEDVCDRYFGSHEVQERAEVPKGPSDRKFGLVFAAIAALFAGLGFWRGTGRWPLWLGVSAVLLILALATPQFLAPFNRLWTKFGLMLHAVISPVVLAILFYGCIAPIGFLMRLSGHDPLRRPYNANVDSYWIKREPPGPQPGTFRNQF